MALDLGKGIDYSEYDFSTLAIRAGWWNADETTGSVAPPLFQTSTYLTKRCEDIEEIIRSGQLDSRFIYTRPTHPNSAILGERLAALEGGEATACFATGVAAITGTFIALVKSGDKIVTSTTLYSATNAFFRDILSKFGVEVVFVDGSDSKNFADAIDDRTKVVYMESPSNPTIELVDIEAVGKICKDKNLITIVDNTFASPYLIRPLDYEGIDLVIESMTKYISGHTDALGGAVIGKTDLITQITLNSLLYLGGIIDPFAAWLITRGTKTMPLRMDQHGKNAMVIAEYLETQPKVEKVLYPGLDSFPQRELAKRLFKRGNYGGMLSFEVKGGVEAGRTLLNNLKFIRLAASLGDCDTLIEHPASMTHTEFFISREERMRAGITDGLVRLSVGLENPNDVIADLEEGFKLI